MPLPREGEEFVALEGILSSHPSLGWKDVVVTIIESITVLRDVLSPGKKEEEVAIGQARGR